jgi:hypothetical protein
MSRTPPVHDWQTLYREAIFESDPTKMPAKLDLAHAVMQSRAFELFYTGAPTTREQEELDTALYFLELLKNFQ